MASKKKQQLQKFCRIFQWVEQKDPAFAGAISDLCMEGALRGGRSLGVTLLYPGADLRKEIVKEAYGPDPEKAIRLLEGHIVNPALHAAEDLEGGAGTRRGVRLELEAGGGDAATLKGGAKIKKAADFTPLLKDNITVWEVVGGVVPQEGPAYERPRRGRGGRGAEAAAAVGGAEKALSDRAGLAADVEGEYDKCMRADRCRSRDPYLAHAVSLLNFLKAAHPSTLQKVLPMVDRDPAVTFYLLVEPHKTTGERVLRDSELFGKNGWNGAQVYEGAVTEFEAFFETGKAPPPLSAQDRARGEMVAPYAAKDPGAVRSAVDTLRLELLGDDGSKANKVETPKRVRVAYEILATKNEVAGTQPVLPDETLRALPGLKKVWQDELRFLLHAALAELRAAPEYRREQFAEVVRMLRFTRPGNDYGAEALLTSQDSLSSDVAPQVNFELLMKFVNSTDFLYVPVRKEKVGGGWGDIPTTRALYDPRDMAVYNAESSKQELLAEYRRRGFDAPRGVSPEAIAEIRHYVAAHGALPPALGGVEAVKAE